MSNHPALLGYIVAGLALAQLAPPATAQVHQVWTTSFDAAYPPNPRDSAGPLALAPSGSIYQAGIAYDSLAPAGYRHHVVITKRSANGALFWSRVDPTSLSSDNFVAALAVTSQDTVVVAGTTTWNQGPSVSRRFVFRLDPTGVLVSSNVDGSGDSNWSAASRLASNDDVLVAGAHDGRFMVERIDAAGTLVWRRTAYSMPTTFLSQANALATNTADEIWAVGGHVLTGGYAAVVAKLGSDGAVHWTTEWPNAEALDVTVDGQDQAYACMGTESSGLSQKAVVALDAHGRVRWVTYLPGLTSYPDRGPRVRLDRFGRIVVLGQRGLADPDVGLWILRADGVLLLDRSWSASSPSSDYPNDLAFGSSDEILALASSRTGPVNSEQVVVAWDPAGRERWVWHSGWFSQSADSPRRLVTDGTTILVSGTTSWTPTTSHDIGLTRMRRTATFVCVGDSASGSCPCANGSQPPLQAGCTTSHAMGGHLAESGASSLANDTLVLHGSDMSNGPALYIQGTTAIGGGAGTSFGDGLRCVGGTVRRIAVRTNLGGASSYPGVGDPALSVVGAVGGPGTRVYQVWFRDAAPYCTPATFNLTNGVAVEWVP